MRDINESIAFWKMNTIVIEKLNAAKNAEGCPQFVASLMNQAKGAFELYKEVYPQTFSPKALEELWDTWEKIFVDLM